MRLQVRGTLGEQTIYESVDWPSIIPAEMGMTVRFAHQGVTYEGDIEGVVIDVTPSSAVPPTIKLRDLRRAQP